jgi:uncharacterized protein
MKPRQLLCLALFFSMSAFAQDQFCETIITQGKSTISQIPEIISFRIELEVEDIDYHRCSILALDKIDSLKLAFSESGLDPNTIRTSSYQTSEVTERDPRTNRSVFRGYKTRIPTIIEVPYGDIEADKIFELLRSAFESEININFRLSAVQVKNVEQELLFMAVQDATDKATALANKLGIEIGSVKKVQYGDPQTIRNFTSPNSEFQVSPSPMSYTSQVRIRTLNPVEISMGASVVIAWEIVNKD